jgi:SAM-dependent methyltransferase
MTPEELHNIFRTEQQFWWYRGMREISAAMLSSASLQGAGVGLDAGCGTGFNAQLFETSLSIKMFGIDLAPLGIQYARQRGLVRSLAASTMELPFADASLDFVSSLDVLTVLPAGGDLRAIGEFARVLKPGGTLFLRAAAFNALLSRHSQFIAEDHRYRGSQVLRMLGESGLQPVRHSYGNFFLSPIAFLKFRVWEPLTNAPPQSGVEALPPAWLNKTLTAILRLEAHLLRRGWRFPFGQSWMVVARKPGKSQ